MSDADDLKASLLSSRNKDGGWPFCPGRRSWTEPTALALLALQAAHDFSEARPLALSWLAARQSPGGGWAPCDTVPTSTWVTSLALLALAEDIRYDHACRKGVEWLANQVYPEPSLLWRSLGPLLGVDLPRASGSSPWFPETAGWVVPTSLSVLALSRFRHRPKYPNADEPIHRAQSYLLSRRCQDGGWNHGGSLQRSETSPSYPETTGLALLALANCSFASLGQTLALAEDMVRKPDSPEGLSWLLIGLAAHRQCPKDALQEMRPKTIRDKALRLIAMDAIHGNNAFMGET